MPQEEQTQTRIINVSDLEIVTRNAIPSQNRYEINECEENHVPDSYVQEMKSDMEINADCENSFQTEKKGIILAETFRAKTFFSQVDMGVSQE